MFVLPAKIAQATEALIVIAAEGAQRPLSGKALAEQLGVPPRFLEQTLQQLVHARLLGSVRGPRGGYRLARDPGRITLRMLNDALCEERPIEAAISGTPISRRVVRPTYQRAEDHLLDYLATISIADLCDEIDAGSALVDERRVSI